MSGCKIHCIGPYEVIASIGAGGMGEVFRARDVRLNRDVALKVLPKDFASNPDRLRRFELETKTLAALNHPNILTIHDAGVHEGGPYLVSELLQGRTLRQEMNGTALPLRKTMEYALQIAQGLSAAHGKNIVHRDLKPENIFITTDGRVKILDFGLAKLQLDLKSGSSELTSLADSEITTLTQPGTVLGTPAYMSPEQVRGEPADQRSDLFCFGCVLYEMVTGKYAFRRNTTVETMNAVLTQEPPEFIVEDQGIPPALERIVHHCLEKSPELRFQSAQDAAFALQTVNGFSTTTGSQPGEARGSLARRSLLCAGFMALGLMVGAAGSSMFWQKEQKNKIAKHSGVSGPLRKVEIYLPLQARPGHPRQVHEAELSPDSRALVYADGAGLWLKWIDRIGPPQLVSTNPNCASPFWSPDSTTLAWFEGEKLLTRSVSGGQPRVIGSLDTPVSNPYGGGVWLRDGRIVCANADGPLFVLPALGGPREVAVPLNKGESDFHKPVVVPGREAVIFIVHGAKDLQTIGYWDPKIGRKDIYTATTDPVSKEVISIGFAPTGHLFYSDFSGIWAVPFSLEQLRVTGPRFRVSENCRWVTFSDDGTLGLPISEMEMYERRQPVWVSRSGNILSPVGTSEVGMDEPQISPDETRILQSALTTGLSAVDTIRQSTTHLIPPDQIAQGGCFDATGQTVYFTRGSRPNQTICSMPTAGGPIQTVVPAGTIADFAREAKFLLLVMNQPEAHFCWLNLASTNRFPTPLPAGFLPGKNLWVCMSAQPRLSPNGNALAYVSYEPGKEGIYCVRFPECDQAVPVFRGSARLPIWRPDGGELFFLAVERRRMMAAAVRWEKGPEFGESKLLFALPDDISVVLDNWCEYDVTRKGDRFLMLRRAEQIDSGVAVVPALQLIENWSQEFGSNSGARF